jgi:hypothetical protein
VALEFNACEHAVVPNYGVKGRPWFVGLNRPKSLPYYVAIAAAGLWAGADASTTGGLWTSSSKPRRGCGP